MQLFGDACFDCTHDDCETCPYLYTVVKSVVYNKEINTNAQQK